MQHLLSSMNMRVLLSSFDPTIIDPHTHTFKRMKQYASACDKLFIISLARAAGDTYVQTDNIEVYAFSGNAFRRLCVAAKTLITCVKEKKCDVISLQEPFDLGLAALWAARARKVALEIQLHGDFYSSTYWGKQRLINRLRGLVGMYVLRRADAIRVVSQRIKQSLVTRGIKDEIIKVIPVATTHIHPVNDQVERIKKQYRGQHIIVTVARLTPEKGVEIAAQAMPYIEGSYTNTQLLIVGEGPQKDSIAATAKSLGIAQNVHFVGHVDNPADYYAAADVVVIPSHTEGWSRVAIEAAHCRVPIVMTDVGLAGEVLKNDESAIIIPTNHPAKLAEAVVSLLKDKTRALRYAQNAYEIVQKLPDHTDIITSITSCWQMLATSHKSD